MHQAPQDLYDAAFAVLQQAYAPYSNFKVACSLRCQDGTIFAGCNVENSSYDVTLCAEASAIGTMITQGKKIITEALILVNDERVASPCGACRQRMFEFSCADTVVHMCTTSKLHRKARLAELLPFAFELD